MTKLQRGKQVNDQEKHKYCTNKFIELANQLRAENIEIPLVSGALMTASGIYATYAAAGNNGALKAGGVDKVTALYRRTLEHHQEIKKAEIQQLQAERAAQGEAANASTETD